LLELAILGLLKEQELHGYELKKRLADTVGPGHGVSFGSLYPALGRLEKTGAVAVVIAVYGAGVHSGAGRGKKVYAITEQGERLFEELLAADAGSGEDERAFNLRLAFARHLSRDARIGMMERRRAYLLERLARTRGSIRHGWGRLDAYTRSLMEHGNETTERDIRWLDLLIARERDGSAQATTALPGSEVSSGVSQVDAPPSGSSTTAGAGGSPATAAPAVPAAAWAAFAAPTMPVRPTGPFFPTSSVRTDLPSNGGNIQ
jgi:DNA-binding PadR family transcriptional regulator